MEYKVINNFLNKDECNNLINDAKKILNKEKLFSFHGGRLVLTCTDIQFTNLYNNSVNWKNLIDKLNCEEFFEFCCKKLDINSKFFKLKKYFNNYRHARKFARQFPESWGNPHSLQWYQVCMIPICFYLCA